MKAGTVYRLTEQASPQFKIHPVSFRLIREYPWPTYDGWTWLHGYELDAAGEAVATRDVFVRIDGLVSQAAGGGRGRTAAAPRGRAAAVRAVA